MKNIRTTKSKKPILFIGLALVLLIVAGASVWYFSSLNTRDNALESIDLESGSEAPKPVEGEASNQSDSDKTIVPTGDESLQPSEAVQKPTITRAQQVNDNIRVTAIFNQATLGSCTVKFEKDGQTVSESAQIVVGPSYYSCDGFLIDKSKFPATGDWDVWVTHIQDGKSSNSDKQRVTIR